MGFLWILLNPMSLTCRLIAVDATQGNETCDLLCRLTITYYVFGSVRIRNVDHLIL